MTKEQQQSFVEELNKLQEKYGVKLTVFLTPANWFAKLFRKFIKVTWQIFFIEDKPKES
jgi:hypothetical protein